MKPTLINRLSIDYQSTMGSYFERLSPESLQAAQELGSAAVAGGLDTLDLAGIHDSAMTQLLLESGRSFTRDDLSTHAQKFFAEAILPLEATHRNALEAVTGLQQLNSVLERLTSDLADSRRALQQQITGRRNDEAELRASDLASSQLLKDSRQLEKQLQNLVRKDLSRTEAERQQISRQLNDDIAQTLLGINLLLLTLKKEITTNHADFTQKLATALQLVDASSKHIRRYIHEFRIQDER